MLARIRAASVAARQQGTLKSISTEYCVLEGKEQEGPSFLVRVLTNVTRKDKERDASASVRVAGNEKCSFLNPFLPYEQSMYVQHVGANHVMLLNKFNVVEEHVLIVTNKFEEQSTLLTCADMTAMWMCLAEMNGVAFYNAGRIAGASQRHKHLQIVTTPMISGSSDHIPFDKALSLDVSCGKWYESAQLNFAHAIVRMDDCARDASEARFEDAGAVTMTRYMQLLKVMSERISETGQREATNLNMKANVCEDVRQPFAYNLVATRKWLMIVPRRKECYHDISVNSLGFVGCLLVRHKQALQKVKEVGGMVVLEAISFSK